MKNFYILPASLLCLSSLQICLAQTPAQQAPPALLQPLLTIIPFECVGGLVLIKAEVDGQNGYFILDTGTPYLMLNSRLFQGIPSDEIIHTVSGLQMEIEVKTVLLNVGHFKKKVNAKIIDFEAIEARLGMSITGAIGNNIFEDCEVVFDYVFKELTIYPLEQNGPVPYRDVHASPLKILPSQYSGSMPSVEVTVGGQVLRMGLDSGASANILDKKTAKMLGCCLDTLGEKLLGGFGAGMQQTLLVHLTGVTMGEFRFDPMRTYVLSLKKLNEIMPGPYLDGILGYEFLSRNRVAFNFRKQEVYFWDNHYVQEQWAAYVKRK